MTTREALHHLVDELPEEQTELARLCLEDLRNALDEDGPPLDAGALASVDRGLADVAEGHVNPLAEYERERGLTASIGPRNVASGSELCSWPKARLTLACRLL